MTINIAPHLSRKKVVKDLQGNIIDLMDEADGGWIVRGRSIVNQEKWDELVQKEKDKAEAIRAASMAKVDENAPDRTVTPKEATENLKKQSKTDEKVNKLEKEVNEVNSKLDQILSALNGKS